MGITSAEFLFQTLKEGWILNNFPDQDYKKIFNDIFCDDRHYLYFKLIFKLEEWNDIQMNLDFNK